MELRLTDYQVIALIAAVFILTVYGYSVGLREGKRIGYHRGRSVSWSTNKEVSK
jgi:hypothetical protein